MKKNPVSRDPEIMSSALVFAGTRVPVKNVFDYIRAGDPLAEFLDNFPSVTKDHAASVLDAAHQEYSSHATPS